MADQPITLRSPFNGETVRVAPDSLSPGMLDAMIQAGFVRLDAPKTTSKNKESRHGTSEADERRGTEGRTQG